MNPNIQQALTHLQNANYSGYFAEMDKVEIPDTLKTPYATHKGVFISGQAPWNFHQLLEVFAKEVEKQLTNPERDTPIAEKTTVISKNIVKDVQTGDISGDFIVGDNNKTTNQNAEKIYNIDKIDKADFS